MTFSASRTLLWALSVLACAGAVRAQDIPAVSGPSAYTGFSLPNAGELKFGITATESGRFGYYDSVISNSSISGNLAYLSGSTLNPFSAVYSGGFQRTDGYSTGTQRPARIFQSLRVSQGFHLQRWMFHVDDNFSYLPDAPAGGLSGIPGLGDVGIPSPTDPNQGILTNYAKRLNNSASGTVTRAVTGRTSVQLTGEYDVLNFLGSTSASLLSNDFISGTAQVTHALSPIRNYFVRYNNSNFRYPNTPNQFSFATQSLMIGYSSALSRQTRFSISAGPQRTSSPETPQNGASYDATVNATFDHSEERSSLTLAFNRAARSGSGITPGSNSQNLTANYNYRLSRVSSVSVNAGYFRSGRIASISTVDFSTQTVDAGVQGARSIGRFLSAYVSYTLLKQSISNSLQSSAAFNGVSHVIAGGITYSPRAIHLGHQ